MQMLVIPHTKEFKMGRLTGKIALITGGNSGIGLASARRFVDEGAFVFITGRRQEELDKAVATIGHDVRALQGDVSKLDDLDRIFASIRADKGHLDIVLANAGLGEFVPLDKITEAHFDRTFDVNVKGTLFTVQKALPLMRAGASIILTGSTTASKGTPAFSVYSATKAAIRNFARSWALDLQGTGIRVNVLTPGPTVTPGLEGLASDEARTALLDAMKSQTALGRLGDPSETAAVALFLASDDSSFMTGSEVFVDGGQAQI
jgi:NAD(P)-dependent dehydrogenase (short-subunit alcohol dehydrogenase family)